MWALLQEISSELLSMYGAHLLVIASQEMSSFRVYIGELHRSGEGDSTFRWLDPTESDREIYLL